MVLPDSKNDREYRSFREDALLPDHTRRAVTAIIEGSLVPESYDAIYATYPTATTEVYTYELNAVVVATITVTYTSSTKDVLTSVVRT